MSSCAGSQRLTAHGHSAPPRGCDTQPMPKDLLISSADRAREKRLHGKSFYEPRAPITVVSVDTLLSRADKYKDFCLKQRVWILDEAAHQLKANKWGSAAALFPNAIGVGFTATPQRLDKKGLGRHAFGLFDTMVQGPTVRWLIDNGSLSRYKVVTPKSDYLDHLEDNGSSTQDFTQKARTEFVPAYPPYRGKSIADSGQDVKPRL